MHRGTWNMQGCLHPNSVPVAPSGGAGTECISCAAQTLAGGGARPHLRALAARLQALQPAAMYAIATAPARAPGMLALVDALCGALAREARHGDSELAASLAEAAAHVCVSCDLGDECQRERYAGSDESQGKKQLFGVCSAVLAHAVEFLQQDHLGSENAEDSGKSGEKARMREAVVRLIALVLRKSSTRGEVSAPSTELIVALREILAHAPPVDVIGLLRDLQMPSRRKPYSSVSYTVDVLSGLLASSARYICECVGANIDKILRGLRDCKHDADRVKVLDLILLALPLLEVSSVSHVQQGDVENDPRHGKDALSLSNSQDWLLTDCLKACVISDSLPVHVRTRQVLQSVLQAETEKPRVACLALNSSGLVDYIFEALRTPGKNPTASGTVKRGGTSFSHRSLSALISMLDILRRARSDEIRSKWSFGIPVVLRAASACREASFLGLCFNLIQSVLADDVVPCKFSSAHISALIDLVMHCGSLVQAASANRQSDCKEERTSFEEGVGAIEVVLSRQPPPADLKAALFDVALCIAALTPNAPCGARVVCLLVENSLDATNSLTEDDKERFKNVFLGTWGDVAISAFRDPDSYAGCLRPLLQVVASALDPRVFDSQECDDFCEAVNFFWSRLPPNLVFAGLSVSRKERSMNPESVARSSDMFSSVAYDSIGSTHDESPCEMEDPSESRGKHLLDKTVRFYLSRLCAESNLVNARDLQEFMPTSLASLRAAILEQDARRERFLAALSLMDSIFQHRSKTDSGWKEDMDCLLKASEREDMLSDAFSDCAIALARSVFRCGEALSASEKSFLLPRSFCDNVLMSDLLDPVARDCSLILHIVSSQELALRKLAWKVSSTRVSRRSDDNRAFRMKLAEIVSANTAAAKSLVTCLLENDSCATAALAMDIVAMNGAPAAISFIKVGLPSMAICAIERLIQGTGSDECFSDRTCFTLSQACCVLKLLNACVQQAMFDDVQRVLLVLIDVFTQTESLQSIEMDVLILRFLAIVFNSFVSDDSNFAAHAVPSASVCHVLNSSALMRLVRILGEASSRLKAVNDASGSSLAWNDNEEYRTCLAATVLDYVIRLNIPHDKDATLTTGGASMDMGSAFETCHLESIDWEALILARLQGKYDHGSSSRSASCMQLLTTVMVCSSFVHPECWSRLRSVISSTLAVCVMSLCTYQTSFLSASALRFVSVCIVSNMEATVLGFKCDNLATFRALWNVLRMKLAASPDLLSPEEQEFLLAASCTSSLKHVEIYEVLSGFAKSSDDWSFLTDSIGTLFELSIVAFAQSVNEGRVASDSAMSLLSEWKSRRRRGLHPASKRSVRLWEPSDILIGSSPILSAPLSMHHIVNWHKSSTTNRLLP